jgi:hypothetical protein
MSDSNGVAFNYPARRRSPPSKATRLFGKEQHYRQLYSDLWPVWLECFKTWNAQASRARMLRPVWLECFRTLECLGVKGRDALACVAGMLQNWNASVSRAGMLEPVWLKCPSRRQIRSGTGRLPRQRSLACVAGMLQNVGMPRSNGRDSWACVA